MNKRAESKSSVNPSIKKLSSKMGEKFGSLNQDITQLSDLLLNHKNDSANHCRQELQPFWQSIFEDGWSETPHSDAYERAAIQLRIRSGWRSQASQTDAYG